MTALAVERLRVVNELLKSGLYKFERTCRQDDPVNFDQQRSAFDSKAKVTFIRGGTGSGKTVTIAAKVAKFITQVQAPPRVDTPFIIVSDSYEQVCNICWKEKLFTLLPHWLIDWERCRWMNRAANWPYAIAMKPWANGNNWVLEFHSLEQGRRSFQGRSFGGFWFSEQFEWDVFDEVVARCRDTWYDGAHVAEFTPLDPDLSIGYEEKMSTPPEGWAEFRLNVYKNKHISEEWRESFLASVSEELRETRRTGEMLSFAGTIYRNFNTAVHVLDDTQWEKVTGKLPPLRSISSVEMFKRQTPQNVFFRRSLDWGESPEHPFCCLWGWKDGGGTWFIFDEYEEKTGLVLYRDRIQEIKSRYPWADHDPHFGMTYADPSRPLLITEFTTEGIITSPASNNVHDGIEYVRQHLQVNRITQQPKIYILKRNCPNLVRQMRKYRWLRSQKTGVTDKRTNPTAAKMEPLKYQDDFCDCLRYLLFSDRVRGDAPGVASSYQEPSRYGLHLDKRHHT